MGGQANYRSASRRVALKRDLVETLQICEDARSAAPARSKSPAPAKIEALEARAAGPSTAGQARQSIRKPTPVAYVRRYRHPALSRPTRKPRPEAGPSGLREEADLVLAFVVRSFAVPELAGLIIKSVLVIGRTLAALRSASGDIEWRPAASPFGPRGPHETNMLSGR